MFVRVVDLKPIQSKTKKTEIGTIDSDWTVSLMSESETKKTIGTEIGTIGLDLFKELRSDT